MAAQTLNDVLSKTRDFHNRLSESLNHSASESENIRAQMLLSYLRDHEKTLARALEIFQKNADIKQLNTWFYEFAQKHNAIRSEPKHRPFSQMSTSEIMAEIMDEHEQIIELYRYLYGRAGNSPARDLLAQLVDLEQHEAMLLSYEGSRVEDI